MTRLVFPPSFYRIAGIASIASAVTTLILIFGPSFFAPVTDGLAGRMQRVTDPAYQLRAWAYFIHPFLAFIAALGVAVACRRVAPALALGAILSVGLWAITEAGQQALTLFAFDDWRRAWLAGDPAVRATMEVRAAIYDGLWNATYSLILVAFIIGNALLSAIMFRLGDILSRVVGGFYAAAVILSIFYFSGQVGGPVLPEQPGSIGFWVYPAIQPIARVLIGVWLLRVALRGEPRVDAAE